MKQAAEIEMPPQKDPRPRHPPTRTDPQHRPPTVPERPEKHDALTHDAVTNKFMATRRLYLAYREKNGMQLESEWTELATFMQFHPDALDEASRKIDVFRGKLRD